MQSIFDFIATQPEIVVNKIYGSSDPENLSSPWACKAIFSSLSALSKNYVFRCLSIHEPLNAQDLQKWVKPELKHLYSKAVDELIKLRILVETSPEGAGLKMNQFFRRGFQYALCNPIEPWRNTPAYQSLKDDKQAPTRGELDDHCSEKWNDVLRSILKIQLPTMTNDSTIENFLRCTGLVAESSKRNHEITSDGYEYLLKDHQSQVCLCIKSAYLLLMKKGSLFVMWRMEFPQVWIFVLQSLSRAQNQEEALVLFFLLSDCKFGNCYPIEALTKSQKQLIFEFSKIGLIYMRSIMSTRFYPTRAAINMLQKSSRSGDGDQSVRSTGADVSLDLPRSSTRTIRSCGTTHTLQVIVETNLQVIAYATSDLHLAMLKLFVDLAVRMPNMAIGKITRERSKEAYRMGIRASQIIEFLQSHAHPKALTRESVVPDNVSDQLLLWEAERYRVQADDVVLLEFAAVRGMTRSVFNNIFTYAKKLNVCVWGSESKLILALKPEGEEHVLIFAEDSLGQQR